MLYLCKKCYSLTNSHLTPYTVKFIVTSVSTGKSRIEEQPKGETEAVIDLSDEAPGSYVVTLVVNGNNVDSSTILIN